MKTKGFTLIELMIVVAIIGILSALTIDKFMQISKGSHGIPTATVVQYAQDGKPLREWKAKFIISKEEGQVTFKTMTNERITLSGSYVVKE